MSLQIRVNVERLLQDLRYAFTNKYTVVSELMQNARRAGATCVRVDYQHEGQILSVSDNGCGISDFQNLLSVAESGWQEELVTAEHAFGIGFMKCLYSAQSCTVVSNGRRLSFDTEAALAGQRLDLAEANEGPGTTVTLRGVDLPDLKDRMVFLAQGFPIQVLFNGTEVLRPYAVDQKPFAISEIGGVWIDGLDTGETNTSVLIFLQGFPVGRARQWITPGCVIHLDSSRFLARLPDRDQLIDESEQMKVVDEALKAIWERHLRQAMLQLSAGEFVERYFDAAKQWNLLALFNPVPALPSTLFARIVDYPIQEGDRDIDYLQDFQGPVQRPDIEAGRLTLIDLDAMDGVTAPLWMYARERQLTIFHGGMLPEDHWVWPHVRILSPDAASVEVLGETVRAPFEATWASAPVVMCEAFVIKVDDDRVVLRDDAMFYDRLGVLLVPEGEASGRVVLQVSSFIDSNDHWHYEDEAIEQAALRDLIRLLRSKDPEDALRILLVDLRLEKYPTLRGKVFTLTVGTAPDRHGIDLVLS